MRQERTAIIVLQVDRERQRQIERQYQDDPEF